MSAPDKPLEATNTDALERGQGNGVVLAKLRQLYCELFDHDGYGEMRVEMRILRRGQKEVIIHCGKQYRYVVDIAPRPRGGPRDEGLATGA